MSNQKNNSHKTTKANNNDDYINKKSWCWCYQEYQDLQTLYGRYNIKQGFFKKRIFHFHCGPFKGKENKKKRKVRGSKNSLDQAQKEKYLKAKNFKKKKTFFTIFEEGTVMCANFASMKGMQLIEYNDRI